MKAQHALVEKSHSRTGTIFLSINLQVVVHAFYVLALIVFFNAGADQREKILRVEARGGAI